MAPYKWRWIFVGVSLWKYDFFEDLYFSLLYFQYTDEVNRFIELETASISKKIYSNWWTMSLKYWQGHLSCRTGYFMMKIWNAKCDHLFLDIIWQQCLCRLSSNISQTICRKYLLIIKTIPITEIREKKYWDAPLFLGHPLFLHFRNLQFLFLPTINQSSTIVLSKEIWNYCLLSALWISTRIWSKTWLI